MLKNVIELWLTLARSNVCGVVTTGMRKRHRVIPESGVVRMRHSLFYGEADR